MMLGNLQCQNILLILIKAQQGTVVLTAGAARGLYVPFGTRRCSIQAMMLGSLQCKGVLLIWIKRAPHAVATLCCSCFLENSKSKKGHN